MLAEIGEWLSALFERLFGIWREMPDETKERTKDTAFEVFRHLLKIYMESA